MTVCAANLPGAAPEVGSPEPLCDWDGFLHEVTHNGGASPSVVWVTPRDGLTSSALEMERFPGYVASVHVARGRVWL